MSKKEYILCAAIWFKDGLKHEHQPTNIDTGIVVCGHRHHNCFYTAWGLNEGHVEHLSEANNRATQGFLTNTNRFVDRKEASKIAFEAGQVNEDDGCLFSEDLY